MFCLYWNVWVFLCHLYSGSVVEIGVVEATTLDGNNELFARWKRFKLRISRECTVFADTVSLLDSIPAMHFAVCTTLCSSFVSPAEQLAYHTVAWVISIYSCRTSARASGLLQLSRKEDSLVNQVSCAEKVTPSYLRFSAISTISPEI